MILNEYGKIAYKNWEDITNHFNDVCLDEFIIMPNHVHGILIITTDPVGDAYMRPENDNPESCANINPANNNTNRNAYMRSLQKTKMYLSKIVQQYKSSVTRDINSNPDLTYNFSWQKSFYDHIIRNEKSYENIRTYIHYNPLKWEWDAENKLNSNPDKNYYIKLYN